ncbi:FAD-dependent oxidoreductase [Mycobacterium sp. Marseille-P9652]|uniref:FAD-dependent oxidoreductase n=1 Tax=Mycobacterium sp. Marseille-P9652 TaxID=2654950 RepID=UPI0012E728BC|nr:NAD(P)/FAD-dependent oxidoreductase [Mycobacterium sp. Marseille-P9652]
MGGMRVLVVGAGVGGISIARALLHDRHEVTVYERHPRVRAAGGAVTIWPTGATVLDQLGVDLDGAGQSISSLRVTTSRGHRIGTFDLRAIGDRLGAPVRMIPRRVLLERLLDGFPSDRIECGRRVVAVDGAGLVFDDGTSAQGDVVIGADGLHSTVREFVGAGPAEPTGWCSWQGLVALRGIPDPHVATMIIGPRGNLGLWPAGGRNLQWWFDLPYRSDRARPERPIEIIRSEFAGWSDSVDRVLATLTDDDLVGSPFPHFRHPIARPGRRSRGAFTLLGDAAHTMPPTLAQGTNQALLDTMVLRRELSRCGDPAGALRRYERARRRNVRVVAWAASRQVSHRESLLRPAAFIPDRAHTWVLATFLRSLSHRRALSPPASAPRPADPLFAGG